MQSNQNSEYLKLCNDASSKFFAVGHHEITTLALVNDATSVTGLKKMSAVCCQIFDVYNKLNSSFTICVQPLWRIVRKPVHCLKQ